MRTFCGLTGYRTLPNKFKSSAYSPSKATKNKEVSFIVIYLSMTQTKILQVKVDDFQNRTFKFHIWVKF